MAASDASFLSRRIDTGTLPLAVGDVLVIGAIMAAGVVRHNGVAILSDDPVYVLLTILPFLVGWAIVAPLVGAYSAGAGESAKASVPLAVRSWVVADVVGVGLRAITRGFHGTATLVFAVVTLLTVGVGLAAWRYLLFRVW